MGFFTLSRTRAKGVKRVNWSLHLFQASQYRRLARPHFDSWTQATHKIDGQGVDGANGVDGVGGVDGANGETQLKPHAA